MIQQAFELVIDFSSNLLTASTEHDEFIATITPVNYLAAIDFLNDNDIKVLPDFVDEIDYPTAEY